MFENQPKGLFALALANTGERFGYYTMLAIFVLFLQANFGFSSALAGNIYGIFLAAVYFLPFIGGILADKFGYGKMVTLGIVVMFLGYILLSLPLGATTVAAIAMFAALAMIALGTGLFKGNLQVMVGNLYDDPKYADKRDSAFSIFYMAINIGALFAPSAAEAIMNFVQKNYGISEQDSYHAAFAVACISLIVSMAIYYAFRRTFKHVEGEKKTTATQSVQKENEVEISKEETKARIQALVLVFAVVIFFWMAFHQNGLTLTLFAKEFTTKNVTGLQGMVFNVWNLVACVFIVYSLFGLFQSKTSKGKLISALVCLLAVAFLVFEYFEAGDVEFKASIFQQFNPFFVIALTPVAMGVFGWLAKLGKEPSAPRKIAYGMLVAALGFLIMFVGSMNLLSPVEQTAAVEAGTASFVSPNWLISTYLVLTFGELLLSPIGISFVSKVAPPKYKGMMMGGWFVATAIGNYLTSIPALLWEKTSLTVIWGVLILLCFISFIFIMLIMKRLEKVSK
ncbi:peptide MFS transporter [Hoylesella nanceiensis]|uniref:peptide MFS transporter n=1 Tax=Hoylesella nanceiensis TaxID=425941 RepID=UPI0028EBAB55|nr:peptide MFS transporter [Hoylesella nanceiensis]